MKKYLLLFALVAGCGASDRHGDNQQRGPVNASTQVSSPSSDSLTGLYEGGAAAAPSQLCVIEKAGQAHFGMIVWGGNLSACSGAGLIERDGERLSFKMTGDQACTVSARMSGGRITLSGPIPPGCSYYCGARASFEGATFDRKGSSPADAMKARDPAGDALCSG